jgi:hypothetical protein
MHWDDCSSDASSAEVDLQPVVEEKIPLEFEVRVGRHIHGGNAELTVHCSKLNKGWRARGDSYEHRHLTNFDYAQLPRRMRRGLPVLEPSDVVDGWLCKEWQRYKVLWTAYGYRDGSSVEIVYPDTVQPATAMA